MDLRRAADKLGWAWVAVTIPVSIWLGQGGGLCPPEGPPAGAACVLVFIGRDFTPLVIAVVAVLGLLLDGDRRARWLSGLVMAFAGSAAGYWAATKQFLGSAWHVPRVPVVIVLTLPPLLIAAERFSRERLMGPVPAARDQQEAADPAS